MTWSLFQHKIEVRVGNTRLFDEVIRSCNLPINQKHFQLFPDFYARRKKKRFVVETLRFLINNCTEEVFFNFPIMQYFFSRKIKAQLMHRPSHIDLSIDVKELGRLRLEFLKTLPSNAWFLLMCIRSEHDNKKHPSSLSESTDYRQFNFRQFSEQQVKLITLLNWPCEIKIPAFTASKCAVI